MKMPQVMTGVAWLLCFTLVGCRPSAKVKPVFGDDRIALPAAPHAAPRPDLGRGVVHLDIRSSGALSLARNPLSTTDYDRILAYLVRNEGTTPPLMFRADSRVPFSTVFALVGIASKRGLFRFTFATREGGVFEFFVPKGSLGDEVNTCQVDGDSWQFNGKSVTLDQLQETIAAERRNHRVSRQVVVGVTQKTLHGQVIAAIDAMSSTGIETFLFVIPEKE